MGMTLRQWISLVTAIGELALAAFALTNGRSSALKTPFALLCLDVSAWTAASLAYMSHRTLSLGVDRVLSPLAAPLALDFVLVFAGARRSSRLVRTAAFVLGGSLSVTSLVAIGVRVWRPFVESEASQIWLLGSALPTMAIVVWTLISHYRRSTDEQERARTAILLFSVGGAGVLGMTDSVGAFVPWMPHLADAGMVAGAAGMGIVTFRFRLFGAQTSRRIVIALGVTAAAALYVLAVVLSVGGTSAVAIVFVTLVIAIAVFAAMRERVTGAAARADLIERLAALGRVSAQLEHDVRNPLAALKGAAQLLRKDLARPDPAINRLDFANLLVEQAERIETLFNRYGRLSRLELNQTVLQVNDVVRSVISRQASGFPDKVAVLTELAPDLPNCLADADLLATIVENLARNSVEAMPGGGTLTVRTSAEEGEGGGVELTLEDTGRGMDARTLERATDDFFTTKPTGSGFGLAFTKRVADAHGAMLTITSQIGRGTTVRLRFPALEQGEP
jgi:signal transduction histidine kinase